jgi:hypothetical protein
MPFCVFLHGLRHHTDLFNSTRPGAAKLLPPSSLLILMKAKHVLSVIQSAIHAKS